MIFGESKPEQEMKLASNGRRDHTIGHRRSLSPPRSKIAVRRGSNA
jgi:hypothetical protein